MDTNKLNPRSLSITLAGEEHEATIRIEYVDGVFRMSTSENGVLTATRDEEAMLFALEYAAQAASSGVTYLVPRSKRSAVLHTAAGDLLDVMRSHLDANQGPTN